jgi:GGDEF domain-containing protein
MSTNIKKDTQKILELSETKKKGYLLQDIGILLFLASVFASVIATVMASEDRLIESAVMFAVMGAAVILAVYKFRYMAVAVAAIQVLVFTAYRIYQATANHEEIGWTSYIWIFVPLTAVGAMLLFQHLNYIIETSNDILASQIDNLVLIHQATGLYNQRALYIDLERQMAYVKRNHLDITLMWIELRYASELKAILNHYQFMELLQQVAGYLEDSIRIEDRLYAIDDDGTFAAMLTCNEDGGRIVKNRIRNGLGSVKVQGSANKNIRIELRIAFLQYDPGKIENAIDFKRKTESELQYDV